MAPLDLGSAVATKVVFASYVVRMSAASGSESALIWRRIGHPRPPIHHVRRLDAPAHSVGKLYHESAGDRRRPSASFRAFFAPLSAREGVAIPKFSKLLTLKEFSAFGAIAERQIFPYGRRLTVVRN